MMKWRVVRTLATMVGCGAIAFQLGACTDEALAITAGTSTVTAVGVLYIIARIVGN